MAMYIVKSDGTGVIPGWIPFLALYDYGFEDCTDLLRVKLPSNLKKIGDYTFKGCSSLQEITIPNSVEEIGRGAFMDCSSLQKVIIPPNVKTLGNSVFWGCKSLTSVVIPEGVTEIGDHAFLGCESLTSVVIPEGVTKIGYSAFEDCTSLTSVVIPSNVKTLGSNAFYGCINLKEIIVPSSVEGFCKNAFEGCDAIIKSNKIMKRNLNDLEIRFLRRKSNSQIIVDKTSYGLESDLVSILSENGEDVSIIDGKSLTSKHDLCERLNEVPNGYILFINLTEIPESEDSDMIKANIRGCIKGDWRNAGSGVIFGSDWMNSLAKKSVGVLIVTNEEDYKTNRELKMMLGMGVCSRMVIGDNGLEL